MRFVNYLLAVLSLIGLVGVGWWGVYQSPHSAANLEQMLQHNAQQALKASGMDWARVEMDGQTARLSGEAPSADAGANAEDVLLASSGPGGVIFGGVMFVENTLKPAPPVSPFVWRATKTESGAFVLSGHVPSAAIRAGLLEEIQALSPSGTVDDQMRLASGAPKGNWQGVARLGVRQLANLNMGEARLEDTDLHVSGIAMDDAVRARVSADVANIAAPFRGIPDIKGASLWSARHADNGLVLAGKVANEEERAEIVQIANTYYAGTVHDEMIIANQAYDGWMDGVRLGLPHFSKFESGAMGFAPDAQGFSFSGKATGSTLAYLRQDMAQLEGPYGVDVAADAVQVNVDEITGIDFATNPVRACQQGFDAVLETNKVYFASGNAEITRDSGVTLDKLMTVSAQCAADLRFELGGYTDNQGDHDFNVTLSRSRAAAVAEYMTDAGIDGTRLSAVGYGPVDPVEDNNTAEGRAENRRIEFKVLDRSN